MTDQDSSRMFVPRQELGYPSTAYYGVNPVINANQSAFRRDWVYKLGVPFGFDDNVKSIADPRKANRSPILAPIFATIDDCLANRRPDLDLSIWKIIEEITLSPEQGGHDLGMQNICIPKLCYDLMISMQLNMATMILLTFIDKIVNGATGTLQFVSKDGSSMANIGNIYMHERLYLCVLNQEFPHKTEWFGNGVKMPALPDTMKTALMGKPLSDLISHPVLDNYSQIIDDIYGDDNDSYVETTYLITDDKEISIYELAQSEITKLSNSDLSNPIG